MHSAASFGAWSGCLSWPEPVTPTIARDNILDTLDSLLTSETPLLFLDGPPGAGKSTALTQFALRHQEEVFCLFARPATRSGIDPSALRFDLCNQLSRALRNTFLEKFEEATDAVLRSLITELSSRALKQNRIVYFVLDGLDDLEADSHQTKTELLQLIPLAQPRFRFLLTGKPRQLPLSPRYLERAQTHTLSFFTRGETHLFLDDLGLTESQVNEVHGACRGMPGVLASVRRLLTTGTPPDALLQRLPSHLREVFELEWGLCTDKDTVLALAILTYEKRQLKLARLAQMAEIDEEALSAQLHALPFITIDAAGVATFVSEAFRKFATQKLVGLRERAHDLIIKDLQRLPTSRETQSLLPELFNDSGRLSELLEYLSPDNFTTFWKTSASADQLRKNADLGISASKVLQRPNDHVRFALHRSIITEHLSSVSTHSLVRGLARLRQYSAALHVAQSAVRNEDRLGLLAVIARTRREQKEPPDAAIDEQIRALYDEIDWSTASSRAEAIAGELVYGHLDLALGIVERSASTERSENSLDWALASLAIKSITPGANDSSYSQEYRAVTDRIKNPLARRLSAEASVLLGESSAQAALGEAEKLTTTADKLYVLRKWMLVNFRKPSALEVFGYAVKLAIHATGYSPNALVFRELAYCLPLTSNQDQLKDALNLLTPQLPLLAKSGPTEDYVRLELLVFRAEFSLDQTRALERFSSLITFVAQISDVATRGACMARMYSVVSRDPTGQVEKALGPEYVPKLRATIDELITGTVDHDRSLRSIVSALAISDRPLALETIRRANTFDRRDTLYSHFGSLLAGRLRGDDEVKALVDSVSSVHSPSVRDEMISEVVTVLARTKDTDGPPPDLKAIWFLIPTMGDASLRTQTCARAIKWMYEHPSWSDEKTRETFADALRTSWDSVAVSWQQIDLGYSIVAELAEHAPSLAREFEQRVRELRAKTLLRDEEAATASLMALHLAIRAFAGLLLAKQDESSDLERLGLAIRRVGEIGEQAELWSDLALRAHGARREELCREIISNTVRPLIMGYPESDQGGRAQLIVRLAPALHVGAPHWARDLFSSLHPQARGECYERLARYQLTGQPPAEPYETFAREGYDIGYDTALSVCETTRDITYDPTVYGNIVGLVNTTTGRRKDSFSRPQKMDLAGRLEKLALEKFPSKLFITHEGYLIASRGNISRLTGVHEKMISGLASSARGIPNVADRAYVLGILSSIAPTPYQRKTLLDEAKALVETLPLLIERVDRYQMLAGLFTGIDSSIARSLVQIALRQTIGSNDPMIDDLRRDLVDSAYRIDADFAGSLASELNDDPARKEFEKEVAIHDLRSTLGAPAPQQAGKGKVTYTPIEYARAAWMKLGSLNAGRSETCTLEGATEVLDHVVNQPLSTAYPVHCWFIQNAVRRFFKSPDARRVIGGLFEASVLSAELSLRISGELSGPIPAAEVAGSVTDTAQPRLIGPTDRARAEEIIGHWLEERDRSRIIIVDPYFSADDFDALALIRRHAANAEITVLCSKQEFMNRGGDVSDIDQFLSDRWRAFSDDAPPQTEFILVSVRPKNEFPIHDRWWLADADGIDLGTSWNSLGRGKVSGIRRLTRDEANDRLVSARMFAESKTAIWKNNRVSYVTGVLGYVES